MQQLSLQFEGYADEQYLSTQSSAKQSSLTLENSLLGNKTFPHWEQIIPSLGIFSRCQKLASSVKIMAQATAACAFAFGLMFFAALIG